MGFSIAAPIGPIGILCIHRTMVGGRIMGLASGLGAATADLLYGCIAGFGLTIISDLLLDRQVWLHIIGGVFLVCLGLRTLLTRPTGQILSGDEYNLFRAYYSTFFLTLLNPVTIIMFTGIMAGLGVGSGENDFASPFMLVLGIFIGSMLWWAILSLGIGMAQNRVNTDTMQWVNRVSGVIITTFGLSALGNWI